MIIRILQNGLLLQRKEGGGVGVKGSISLNSINKARITIFFVFKKERCVKLLFGLRSDELRVKIIYVTFLWTEGN